MVTMFPSITSYHRVHLLISSCGKRTFDLEINMIRFVMKMLQKVEKHIFVANFTNLVDCFMPSTMIIYYHPRIGV